MKFTQPEFLKLAKSVTSRYITTGFLVIANLRNHLQSLCIHALDSLCPQGSLFIRILQDSFMNLQIMQFLHLAGR
jgi:hypothetical protein